MDDQPAPPTEFELMKHALGKFKFSVAAEVARHGNKLNPLDIYQQVRVLAIEVTAMRSFVIDLVYGMVGEDPDLQEKLLNDYQSRVRTIAALESSRMDNSPIVVPGANGDGR